jgi:hypothetical protein
MNLAKILLLPTSGDPTPSSHSPRIEVAKLIAIQSSGRLRAECLNGQELDCEWLDSGNIQPLEVGDRVLVATIDSADAVHIVLGRLGAYVRPDPGSIRERHVTIEATESLQLRCGDASVELRADGKAMVKGDDVLIRAKGTQRIRAGTVSIN